LAKQGFGTGDNEEITKHQDWILEFGASLVIGSWALELCSHRHLSQGIQQLTWGHSLIEIENEIVRHYPYLRVQRFPENSPAL
jgi:hypothetical protein